MIVCKLNSVLSLGSSKYVIKTIKKTKVTLLDLSSKKTTDFNLNDLEYNLTIGTMKVERV